MMIARIYGLMWLFVAAIAGALYLTDSFTFAATMILGFTTSVLAGAGLLVVYPVLMTERVSLRYKDRNKTEQKIFAAGKLQRAS